MYCNVRFARVALYRRDVPTGDELSHLGSKGRNLGWLAHCEVKAMGHIDDTSVNSAANGPPSTARSRRHSSNIFGFMALFAPLPAHVTGNMIFLAADIARHQYDVIMKIAALPIFA